MEELQRHLFDPKDISAEMSQYFEETETECGSPWERVIEKSGGTLGKSWHNHERDQEQGMGQYMGYSGGIGAQVDADGKPYAVATLGWRPSCNCGTEHPIPQEELDADPTLLDDFEIEPYPPIPCTVLDPFGGSGTTADVARQLGRRWIMIELSEVYCQEHIIPRLTEPLMEWAEQQESDPRPEPQQLTF